MTETTPKAQRRDAGQLQITERDILALTWIAEQYCISYDQLRRLLAIYSTTPLKDPEQVGYTTAMNAVQRWLKLGLIDTPKKIIHGYTTHIWLSRKGITHLNLPFSYYSPKPSNIPHFYATNAIRLSLQNFGIHASWKARRILSREYVKNPLPDAEIHDRTIPLIAAKIIERPIYSSVIQEEYKTLSMLLQRYTRIWYFVHTDSLSSLHQTFSTLSPEEYNCLVFFGLDAKEIQS